jgi:hypothetical protein
MENLKLSGDMHLDSNIYFFAQLCIYSNILNEWIVTWQLKARIVKQIDVAIARQRRGEYISAATDTEWNYRGCGVFYAVHTWVT